MPSLFRHMPHHSPLLTCLQISVSCLVPRGIWLGGPCISDRILKTFVSRLHL